MAISPSDIRFIFYLPNLRSYLDRADMIGKLADKVGRGVLVTSVADAELLGPGSKNLEVVEVPRGRSYPGRTAIAASKTVGQLLDTGDFNIVHDTFAHLGPLFLRRRKHPNQVYLTSFYILGEWDLRHWIWPRYKMRSFTDHNLRQWATRTITQRIITRLSDNVVVQAPGLIERVAESNNNARPKLEWIPNNVVSEEATASTQQRDKSPQIRLLWVGGFVLAKGADKLLTLLARGMERGIPVHATALGTSSPLDRSVRPHVDHLHLRERIESEGLAEHIDFLGRVDPREVDSHYKSADWLVHISEIDGSPRVVLEALVRGLPVVGSRHPGIAVLDPEENFILFSEPFEPDAILDRIVEEKSNPAAHAERSQAGSEAIRQNFSSDAISDRYVDLYMRLLSQRVV